MTEETLPVPTLKLVDKFLKNKKDPDFLSLFDTTKTQYYSSLRHKYDILYENSRKDFDHLRLFTKHLKKLIEKNKTHFEQLKDDLLDYRREEPTLQPIRHSIANNTKTEEEISLHLPTEFDDGRAASPNAGPQGKKLTEEAMADVYNYDWKLTNLGSIFYNRLQSEISAPLTEFRKQFQQKLHKIHETVAAQYDNMVKNGVSARDKQVQANVAWNELCDHRARLEKAIKNKKDSKIKKHNGRVQDGIKKVKKLFEDVVESIDKYNQLQETFWNIQLVDATNQLEAINHSRSAFLQEYIRKYVELLDWKRAEERNGEEEIQQSINQLMSPSECVRVNTNHISFEHGNYHSHDITDYQIPCMPNEVATVTPPLSQQRIDPNVILPIFDPFSDQLNNATSGGKRMSSVRSVSSVRNKTKNNANPSSQILTTQRSSFFADNTAKLFARTSNNAARRVSASAATSPNSRSSETGGLNAPAAAATPKHSSLALLQSVSRTSSLDDAKEDPNSKNHNNAIGMTPPILTTTKSADDSASKQHLKNQNIVSGGTTPPVDINDNNTSWKDKYRRPPLPPRSNSARFGSASVSGISPAVSPNSQTSSNGGSSTGGPPLPNRRPIPTPSRPLPTTPQRDRRGGMATLGARSTSKDTSESKDETDTSDSDSDLNNNNNSGNMDGQIHSSFKPKNKPPVGGRAPPPPKKDAKTVATFVVRKATLESMQSGDLSSSSSKPLPPLPPRTNRPKWKMTMN